jgi:hypothetical protein
MLYFLQHREYLTIVPGNGSGGGGKGGGIPGLGGKGGGSSGGATDNQVTIGDVSPSGTNAVSLSSPHIVQYPRPPKRDDGRWIALSSVIGNIIGKLSSQKVLKEARDAEKKWREVMEHQRQMAHAELARVPILRDRAEQAMNDIDKRNTANWQRGDLEYGYGEQLKPCIDNLADEICAISDCGYQPDYDGIHSRIAADAALAEQKEFEKLCRVNNRYNTGWNCNTRGQLLVATQNIIIAQTNKAREEERQRKWQHDYEIKTKTFDLMERARQNRQTTAQNYDRTATENRRFQYSSYTQDADNSLKMGADLLASYGQNAAWLAESLRKTAKESMADWGTLATMIIGLLFAWNMKSSAAKADDCGGGSGGGKGGSGNGVEDVGGEGVLDAVKKSVKSLF